LDLFHFWRNEYTETEKEKRKKKGTNKEEISWKQYTLKPQLTDQSQTCKWLEAPPTKIQRIGLLFLHHLLLLLLRQTHAN
jgi:hypothetical protein